MNLPVGYFKFHKDAFINYQLNRWHSLGFTRKEDIEKVGRQIKTFEDYVRGFVEAGDEALAENRIMNAAFYYRAAEFLVDPDDAQKMPLYDKFQELFYRGLADAGIERHKVPYAGSFMPAMNLAPRGNPTKGTLVAFGGFDSFIEDFYGMWSYFADAGYEVIAFDGPGQGGALRTYNLPFDHDWEKPVATILDHFKLDNVTLLGVSMGGYWSLRAAAYEKRISRVIALPPVYDWMEMAGGFNRGLVNQLLKMRGLMNWMVKMKMSNGKLRHTIKQALFLAKKSEPIEAVEWMMGMNKEHLHSELVNQDVLLAGGEHDAFQPPMLIKKQHQALVNAKSVTVRIFTKAEHADQHCQIGNLGLASQTLLDWMEKH